MGGQQCALPGRPCVQHPPPSLGGADPAAKATPTRLFPQGTEGHPCSPHSSGSLQGEEMGLDSPSPPSIPTSHVTKVPVQKESRDKPRSVQEGTLGLDNQKRAHAQVSPLWRPLPLHCYLVIYSHVVCPQLLRYGCCSLVELLWPSAAARVLSLQCLHMGRAEAAPPK